MLGELFGIAISVPIRFPLYFPIFLLAVIFVSALFSFLASWGVLGIMEVLHGDQIPWKTFDNITNTISLIIFAFFLWGFMVQVLIALIEVQLDRTRDRVAVLCELLFAMVVIFAVLHYYVAIFTGDAYNGLEAKQAFIIDDFGEAVGNILSLPTLQTAVDFLYFSAVTFSTVGFGDMYPIGTVAKLLTVLQIVFGFSVIIVSFGRAFGERS